MKLLGFSAPVLVTALAAITTSCSSDGFGRPPNPPRLVVDLVARTANPALETGTLDKPLDLQVGVAVPFKIRVRAIAPDNSVDTTFNRYVRISAKPGAVASFTGADVDGRNLLLKNGESIPIDVNLTNAYGTTYFVADDLGYVPADPLRQPPPACSNGIDDDGDGVVDFPADNGCAFANDDSEESGTYAQGTSPPIFFRLPRVADVRGIQCDAARGCTGNGRTPYPREQILLNTGWREDNTYAFSTVVTRLSADGFYVADLGETRGGFVTDLGDTRGSFTSIFAFNFNAPPRMRVCDRVKTYGGTANEFFGFTQISYPTWTLEDWDPAKRPCLVPAPERLKPTTIRNPDELLKRSANLVRVETTPKGEQKIKVTPKFGPGDVPKSPGGAYVPGPDNSNCDFDKNGKINSFAKGSPEGECSTACTADAECTEYSNYAARGTFRITVTDSNGNPTAIQADASTAAGFDPLASKGKPLRSVTGTLSFFSGGAQYTIEVRCKDDLIVDLRDRPFLADSTCTTNAECTVEAGLPPEYECLPLSEGAKACRKRSKVGPPTIDPPPQACVFPRTFNENNPQ